MATLTLLFAGNVSAENGTFESNWFESTRTDLHAFRVRLQQDTKATFLNRDNAAALLWAGVASVAMNNGRADEDIASYFERYDTVDGIDAEALGVIGSPAAHFPAAAVWYALSVQQHDEVNTQRAATMFTALTINGAATVALKAVAINWTTTLFININSNRIYCFGILC